MTTVKIARKARDEALNTYVDARRQLIEYQKACEETQIAYNKALSDADDQLPQCDVVYTNSLYKRTLRKKAVIAGVTASGMLRVRYHGSEDKPVLFKQDPQNKKFSRKDGRLTYVLDKVPEEFL
jgi:hypothetical protein